MGGRELVRAGQGDMGPPTGTGTCSPPTTSSDPSRVGVTADLTRVCNTNLVLSTHPLYIRL